MQTLSPVVAVAFAASLLVALSGCGEKPAPKVFSGGDGSLTVPFQPGPGKANQYNFFIGGIGGSSALDGKIVKIVQANLIGARRLPSEVFLIPPGSKGSKGCNALPVSYGAICPQARTLQGSTITLRKGQTWDVVGSISAPTYRGGPSTGTGGSFRFGPWGFTGVKLTYTVDGRTVKQTSSARRGVQSKKFNGPVKIFQPEPIK